MILIDSSQFFIGALMSQSKMGKLDENLVRHIFLNSLRQNRTKFYGTYGELVLCIDSKEHWRKGVFPYYKANRKKAREASAFDWKEAFKVIDVIKQEIVEVFPYKFVSVDGAEGDDIIATLIKTQNREKNLILSSDKDFIQLHKYPNVSQYDMMRSKWIKDKNPELFLREHIIRGDASDGVPNMLSADDVLATAGKKQKSIFQKNIDNWLAQPEDVFYNNLSEFEQSNYSRNKMLIDLDHIPEHITEKILEEFRKEPTGNRSKILNYFIKHKLRELTKCLGDF